MKFAMPYFQGNFYIKLIPSKIETHKTKLQPDRLFQKCLDMRIKICKCNRKTFSCNIMLQNSTTVFLYGQIRQIHLLRQASNRGYTGVQIWNCTFSMVSQSKTFFTGCFKMTHDMRSGNMMPLSHTNYTKQPITSKILAETYSDLSTISRFLCLSLLASRMASHFCKSASLQGPGVKLMGGTGVPIFQDWILRVNISSFFWRYDGTNTLQLLLFSLDGHVLSRTQRNFAWISGGRVQGSGKGIGWYLSGAPDRGTSFFCAGIRRTIISSFSRSGSTSSPSLHCRIMSRSTRSSCSENLKSSKARRTHGLAWKAPVFLTKKSSFSKSGSRADISRSPPLDPGA